MLHSFKVPKIFFNSEEKEMEVSFSTTAFLATHDPNQLKKFKIPHTEIAINRDHF